MIYAIQIVNKILIALLHGVLFCNNYIIYIRVIKLNEYKIIFILKR